MTLLPGVRSATADTDRLRMHYLESGPADGVPLVLLHGNLSTGRFYEHLMPRIPERFRVIAPEAERERLDRALVADLRAASGRYPDDPG